MRIDESVPVRAAANTTRNIVVDEVTDVALTFSMITPSNLTVEYCDTTPPNRIDKTAQLEELDAVTFRSVLFFTESEVSPQLLPVRIFSKKMKYAKTLFTTEVALMFEPDTSVMETWAKSVTANVTRTAITLQIAFDFAVTSRMEELLTESDDCAEDAIPAVVFTKNTE